MKIYKDIITGDEMFADTYKMKLVDDVIYEVYGKLITRQGDDIRLEGANASAEEADEGTDITSESGVDVVLNHRLTECFAFGDKKSYTLYLKDYMKKVLAKLEEKSPDQVDIFKTNMNKAMKDIPGRFKELQFFPGETLDCDGMVALLVGNKFVGEAPDIAVYAILQLLLRPRFGSRNAVLELYAFPSESLQELRVVGTASGSLRRIKNLMKAVVNSCKVCVIHKKRLQSQLMGVLPKERASFSRPFTYTGMDYAGPFDIKNYTGRACLITKGPHSPMSEDPTDLLALTPGHFLVGGPLMSTVEPEIKGETKSILNRWQHLKALHQQFRVRWKEEYLKELHKRSKWQAPSKNLRIDDMVVIKDDNLPSNEWRLGRIESVFPGADGNVRICARFLKLSAEKRLRAVLINKYCANCLVHEHSTGDCRSGDRCKKCDRSHHTLLHMHKQVSSLSRSRARSRLQPVPTRQAASASSQRSRRKNPPTQRRSSPPRRPESTRIDANFKLEVVLKIEPRVRNRTPVRALSDTVVSKFRDIMLADDQFHRPATVSMVLGADVYPKVIQSGFLTFDEGIPVA
ncbi:GD11927 [Drosophila simulans]|uniref:Translationally-controlled tumor protein homolog n=1 Tax=Drosophila simulans TaxID=7240 RepID=B4NTK7_DROSI|nr:GD11927 [Drosophila simulans]